MQEFNPTKRDTADAALTAILKAAELAETTDQRITLYEAATVLMGISDQHSISAWHRQQVAKLAKEPKPAEVVEPSPIYDHDFTNNSVYAQVFERGNWSVIPARSWLNGWRCRDICSTGCSTKKP